MLSIITTAPKVDEEEKINEVATFQDYIAPVLSEVFGEIEHEVIIVGGQDFVQPKYKKVLLLGEKAYRKFAKPGENRRMAITKLAGLGFEHKGHFAVVAYDAQHVRQEITLMCDNKLFFEKLRDHDAPYSRDIEKIVISNSQKFEQALIDLEREPILSLDVETEPDVEVFKAKQHGNFALNPQLGRLELLGLGCPDGRCYIFTQKMLTGSNLRRLKELLAKKHLIMHNAQFDIQFLWAAFGDFDWRPAKLSDTMVLAYLYHNRGFDSTYGSLSLKALSRIWLDQDDYKWRFTDWFLFTSRFRQHKMAYQDYLMSVERALDSERSIYEIQAQVLVREQGLTATAAFVEVYSEFIHYLALDLDNTIKLYEIYDRLLDDHDRKVEDLLVRATYTFGEMAYHGVPVDPKLAQVGFDSLDMIKEDVNAKLGENVALILEKIGWKLDSIISFRPRLLKRHQDDQILIDLLSRYNQEIQNGRVKAQFMPPLAWQRLKAELEEQGYGDVVTKEKTVGGFAEKFNVQSPYDLQSLFYDLLELDPRKLGVKPTDKNQRPADKATLHTAIQEYPEYADLFESILEVKELHKVMYTYLEKVIKHHFVVDDVALIQGSVKLTNTVTGRTSSSSPTRFNLQNVVKTEHFNVRDVMIAPPGYAYVQLDYSRLEFLIAGIVSKDKNVLRAFTEGIDIHSLNAANAFNVDLEDVTKKQRSVAKTLGFGLLYGGSPFGLQHKPNIIQAGLVLEDIERLISNLRAAYPAMFRYMDWLEKTAIENGEIVLPTGRREKYVVPDETDYDGFKWQRRIERQAKNFPIQSLASDCTVHAVIELHEWLKTTNIDGRLLVTIHDSINGIVAYQDLSRFVEKAVQIMQKSIYHVLPDSPIDLQVDVEVGTSYGNLVEIPETDVLRSIKTQGGFTSFMQKS